MIKLYGGDNGFGWSLDDVIGAQIVSVPVSVPDPYGGKSIPGDYRMAWRRIRHYPGSCEHRSGGREPPASLTEPLPTQEG